WTGLHRLRRIGCNSGQRGVAANRIGPYSYLDIRLHEQTENVLAILCRLRDGRAKAPRRREANRQNPKRRTFVAFPDRRERRLRTLATSGRERPWPNLPVIVNDSLRG